MKNEQIIDTPGGRVAIAEATSGRPLLSVAAPTRDGAYMVADGIVSAGVVLDYESADELCNWLMSWLSEEDAKEAGDHPDDAVATTIMTERGKYDGDY